MNTARCFVTFVSDLGCPEWWDNFDKVEGRTVTMVSGARYAKLIVWNMKNHVLRVLATCRWEHSIIFW